MDTLYPYQIIGADWLSQARFRLLADEMGLGKTAQAVTACDAVGAERVLVICPAVARVNWRREFARWELFSRDFDVLVTGQDEPLAQRSAICSFEYATRYCGRLTACLEWDAVIIDEVHFLKSIDAKRSKAILGRGGIVHHAKRIWVLSGTPAPNHVGELWTLLYVFGATKLTQATFIDHFCNTVDTGYGLQVVGTKRARISELRELLSRVMLRREKKTVLKELPPISFTDVTVEAGPVELGEEEMDFGQYVSPDGSVSTLKQTLAAEEELLTRSLDQMRTLEGLASSVSTLRRYLGLQKVAPVAELVAEELESGLYEKVVLFAIHRSVIAQLEERLRQFSPVSIHGGTSPRLRQAAIDQFQDPKSSVQIFIGQIQAAGTNITLTAAHQALVVEQDWVPGNNLQAAMRLHRIGQTRNVQLRFVQLDHPLDARVTEIVKRKTRELAKIFETRYC